MWQFQQGGVDLGEDLETTLWRELAEEVGLQPNNVARVTEYPKWTVYQYDYTIEDHTVSRLGQVHRWYFLELQAGVEINLTQATENEASAVRFITFDQVIAETDNFKRAVYRELREYFLTTILPTISSGS